jgi:hypothetical protein
MIGVYLAIVLGAVVVGALQMSVTHAAFGATTDSIHALAVPMRGAVVSSTDLVRGHVDAQRRILGRARAAEVGGSRPDLLFLFAWRDAPPIRKRHERFVAEGGRFFEPSAVTGRMAPLS